MPMPWIFVKHAGLFLYAMVCGAAMSVLAIQDNEWMIGEQDRDGQAFTICTIPAPGDDTSDVALPVALILIAPLLLAGLLDLARARRIGAPLLLGVALLFYGAWLFFGRAAFC
jgi:Protein of unknown function (DUF2645)